MIENKCFWLNVFIGKIIQIPITTLGKQITFLMRLQYQFKYELCRVCLSVRMEQLGFEWRDFYQIWYSSTFPKFDNIQLLLKSDNNNSFFTRSLLYVYGHISIIFVYNETNFKVWRQNRSTQFMFNIFSTFLLYLREFETKYCRQTGHTCQNNTAQLFR